MVDPLIGALLGGRYRLVSVLGQGGMGIVYKAEDARLAQRLCAIKLLMGTSMDPEEGARFERELAVISRVRSAHIVQVLDTGKLDDGRRYIVMELLEGMPLETFIKRNGAVAPSRAVPLFKGVLAALADAHERGVIHRDLKPANVFVGQSRTGHEVAKVLDFGIAKDMRQGDSELTAASMLIGTPKYMAPEQFLKLGAEPATDLYAAGLLFYQLLAGRPPFLPEDPVPDALLNMPGEFRVGWLHVNQTPAPLAVDPALWAILDQLLAKDPRDRYQDAQTVIDALGALEGVPARLGDPSAPLVGFSQEISSTTGFPVLGESLGLGERRAPLNVDAGDSHAGRWIAVAAVVVLGLGTGAFFLMKPGADPLTPTPAAAPMKVLGAGICLDHVVSEPSGAMVLQGETPLGTTPLEIERPCREVWQVGLFLDGHEEKMLTLRGREPRAEVAVALKVKAAAAPSAAPAVRATVAPQAPLSAAAPATEALRPGRPRAERPAGAAPVTEAAPRPRPAERRVERAAPEHHVAPATAAPAAPATVAPAPASPLPF